MSTADSKNKTKPKKKSILLKIIWVLVIWAFSAAIFSIYYAADEQTRYEARVKKSDGKLYPQEEPIGLVQRVINTPTYISENRTIALMQYFFRMIAVQFPSMDRSKLYCCELMERYKNPPYFILSEIKGTHHSYEIVEQNDNQQIISVKTSHPNYSVEMEAYFTVIKTKEGWRVDKYRYLVSADVFYSYVNNQTDSMDRPEIIDENIQHKYPVSMNSARLALKTDSQLIKYFNENKKKFYELKHLIDSQNIHPTYIDEFIEENQSAQNFIRDLQLTTVVSNYNNYCQTCTFYIIAGEKDDTVGYLYLTDKSRLPHITGNALIIIREIGNGWYFYKST